MVLEKNFRTFEQNFDVENSKLMKKNRNCVIIQAIIKI